MPHFKEHENERVKRKLEDLAPYLEEAMARKERMKDLEDVPEYSAYGRSILDKQSNLQIS